MRAYISHCIAYSKNHLALSLGVLFFCALLLIGSLLLWSHLSSPTADALRALILTSREEDHIQGNPTTARAILIVYSDFECTACGVYYSVLKQLQVDMGADLVIVFRHFPYSATHPNADLAARATEAAGAQGKFFEMHDRLFETQTAWVNKDTAREIFIEYAKALSLNVDQFTRDLDGSDAKKIVTQHLKEAKDLSLKSSPSFFVNGTLLPTFRTYAEFKTHIINTVYTQ